QFVVDELGEPGASDCNASIRNLLGRPLVGVGDREWSLAGAYRRLVGRCLRDLETLLDPRMNVLLGCTARRSVVEVSGSIYRRAGAGTCPKQVIPEGVKFVPTGAFAKFHAITTPVAVGQIPREARRGVQGLMNVAYQVEKPHQIVRLDVI